MFRHTQQGVALVTAVLIVALAAVLATSLVSQLNLDISRTENIIQNEQAYLYTLSAEPMAHFALQQDDNEYDSKHEYWAEEIAGAMEGGQVAGHLEDLQGRFNLNNLSTILNASNQAKDLALFKRLLEELELSANLAAALVDWIDADVQSTIPDGAEDDYYIGLEKPYRAANGIMSSPSELRQVKGFNEDDTYDKLKDLVTTLPAYTPININTAPKEVLKSLTPDMTDADVDAILLKRDGDSESESDVGQAFETLDDFKNYMITTLNKKTFTAEGVSVSSSYFLMTAESEIGRGKVKLYSIFYRDNGATNVISRSQGAL